MLLDELLKDIYPTELEDSRSYPISSICCDSRTAEKDSLFIAMKGAQHDGAAFVEEAIRRGARVIVSNNGSLHKRNGVLFLHVADPQQFLRSVTQRFYGPLSSRVKCVGITGTNGKTTITYLVESILKEANKNCGIVGTVNCRIGARVLPTKNTTPGLAENQRFLADLSKEGIEYCVMEVSSHGLDQGRVDLIDFKSAVFTNLTSDHLDYHKTRENYFLAKARLFTGLSSVSSSIINGDDPYGQKLVGMTKSRVLTYGISDQTDITAKDIKTSVRGSSFKLRVKGKEILIETKLIGLHNVYNILAAVGVGLSENIPLDVIAQGIAAMKHVPGRLERIDSPKGFSVFIDYAHTEDALKNVLEAIRQIGPQKIITVFGCGGDRDKTKRPKMGAVAGQLSDMVIVTNDNPRSEDPQAIINEIIAGFTAKNYQTIADRKEAIHKAIDLAKSGDVVLVAGKGHEDYQIFKDKTIPFNERQIVEKYLGC